MVKYVFIIGLTLSSLASKAQFGSECFDLANEQMQNDIKTYKEKHNDTVLVLSNRLNMVIGCRFPYFPMLSHDKKEINPNNLKADYVIMNYNYSYCDQCMLQLDELVKLKQSSKKNIQVIAIFLEKTDDLTYVIEKYGKDIFISGNGSKWVNEFGLGLGSPMTYVLDKNKIISTADPLNYNDKDHFSKMLEQVK